MALKIKMPYHRRLFALLLTFLWALVICFIAFQYGREKHFKADKFNDQLQMFNTGLVEALASGEKPADYVASHTGPSEDLRVTIIDRFGRVVFDTSADEFPLSNHLDRPEVIDATTYGTGFTIRRHSESTNETYFYSAMRGEDGMIVRSAIPYTLSLIYALSADFGFLWFMVGITILMTLAGYFATRRLGQNITRLNEFAEQAERGERIDQHDAFPHDELGEISEHIISLYARLQKTTADRNREHAIAMHEEQEKIRIKKQLTNNINHELKTPVAAIQGYLEILMSNPGLAEATRRDFIAKSHTQAERLRSLLSDVSTITRIDEASDLIGRERVCLNDIVADIASDMGLYPEEKRLRVNCDFPRPVEVVGSPSLLASIFRNLTENAVSYSGGRDIFIRLLSDSHDSCTILFADNGIGVDEDHLPHIFERFYRIDTGRSRKLGGTGLGLAIVKNAVAIHGGAITVRNRERGGLEFVFTLRKSF